MPAPGHILLNQKIFAPYKIATLVETVAEQGITAEEVLRNTHLDASKIYDPNALTSVHQYIGACENVIRAAADASTAFQVGARMHLSAYGMYGYALMCSLTLRDFFDFGVKYHVLATPTLHISWREEAETAIWEFSDIYLKLISEETREFLIQQQMAQHVTHLHDAAGPDCRPIKALFSFPAPRNRALYERWLECDCLFDESVDELHYSSAILNQAPQLANRLTRSLLQETCDRLIGKAKTSSGVSGEVYQLMMLTPNRFPTMEEVAQHMRFTTRTLRRKLGAEGTDYGAILDDVRSSLAVEYLQTTKMSTEDIAAKLGFSDGTNFRRAFKRWTGKTPRQIRDEGDTSR
ncbi:AraC family transcriptional regulator [Pseudomonas brassicacearum]|uniref:AraC family transcriptional regulator n=1 Tax=Pseudomonas TaxID=286 RepID=UPI0018E6FAB6|nr:MULTISPECIES: AraC family transcriptional regulator [Pseudomonas]MBJ2345233.1 AraC family transcriptional regulator [Pseudomonas canavaninivorans]MBL3541324.1 AraC family transcriptional regulator [Pseudomonas sp. HB05]UVM46846.1 AraC family transcriptional regulator [Pseudomonas brassicacearum]